MPYEFQVLRCFSCETFQVHQVKKAPKWNCRVCGAKQSLIKAFKIGASRECRELVQKLNMEKGLLLEGENQRVQQGGCQDLEFENNFPQGQMQLESDDDVDFEEDNKKSSPEQNVPGLDPPCNTEVYQPSSLRNALHAFYCATDMNTLTVLEKEKLEESSADKTRHSLPLLKEGTERAVIGRKNKGFSLIQEKAKRMRLNEE